MQNIFLESVDSTNTYLKNNYDHLQDLTFVSTNSQTQGKGRTNRVWESEKDKNLLFSLLILNKSLFSRYKSLSIISAYSIVQVLNNYGLKNISIKWPNDVYVNNEKICGILLEAVSKNDVECLIVGVGLNVNQINFNGNYIVKPTSMKKQLNKDVDLDTLRQDVYNQLLENLDKLNDDYDFYSQIRNYDYLKSKEVYALIGNQKKLVKVIGINNDYSLRVNVDGTQTNINSGEISFHI